MRNVFMVFTGWGLGDVKDMALTEFIYWHNEAIEIDKQRREAN